MRNKHTETDRLHSMKMIEKGYSIDHIHKRYGISSALLKSLWLKYQSEGVKALKKKKNIQADGVLKGSIVKDIEENGLTLVEASIKYNVSANRLSIWL